ncbi:MAG: sigma-54 dependent transcriptional regulator [Fibrobacterales bacterium]
MNIIIVDDDKALAQSLQIQLDSQGHTVAIEHNPEKALELVKPGSYDLMLLDLTMPEMSGIEVLNTLKDMNLSMSVIVISGRQDMESTIKAIQLGAFDYLRKPLDMDAVTLGVEKVKSQRLSQLPVIELVNEEQISTKEIVGNDPRIIDILKNIGLLSRNKVSVLITGESGTGKELVAKALHSSTTPSEPFIAVNCSAIVDTLLESELFGHVKGAFTGANEDKKGKLELAGSGTLFFDEIGEMSITLQAKLLRVLQEQEFEPVGSAETRPFKARALFATHRDLYSLIKSGGFREDLYYRIAVATLQVPSLRERENDIAQLAHHLLKKIIVKYDFSPVQLSEEAVIFLKDQPWMGNIRELENTLLRSISLTSKTHLGPEDIKIGDMHEQAPSGVTVDSDFNYEMSLAELESWYINSVLKNMAWNITHTANALGISPTTLRKKIKDYAIERIPGS